MSVVVRNSYGAIAVNKGVIERMIIEDMLGMNDVLMLSDKKGRPIKERPTPFIDPDYFDAVEVSDKKGIMKVKVYVIINFGNNISDTADRIFDTVEKDFEMLRLGKPASISVKVRGIAGVKNDEIIRRNIDVVRSGN